MTTTTNCGDSCGLIDFTMAVAGDRLLPEERMELAIKAVTIEKMSQRGAAEKFNVAQRTLSHRIEKMSQMAHPGKTQSQPEVLPEPEKPAKTGKLKSGEIRSELRKLCSQNNAPRGLGVNGQGVTPPIARGWLKWAGIAIPPELDGKTEPFTPSSTPSSPTPAQPHDTNQQGLPANDPLPVVSDWGTQADSPDDPIYDDDLDIDAVRDHVCAEVQRSDRPADFKRAIDLLRELDQICTDAWYRRHPEPWNHHDWAHVNSEIKTIQSLVGQRAQETADQLLFPGSAVTVKSTPVA